MAVTNPENILGVDFSDVAISPPGGQDTEQPQVETPPAEQPVVEQVEDPQSPPTTEAPEEGNPETVVEETPPEGQSPEATPTGTETPGETPTEEATVFQDIDASFFDTQPESGAGGLPQVPATPQQPVQPDYSEIFGTVSTQLGLEQPITTQEQLTQQIDQLRVANQALSNLGITAEMAKMYDQGFLTREELLKGSLSGSIYGGNYKDAAFDSILASDPNLTEEQINEMLDELPEAQQRAIGGMYMAREEERRKAVMANYLGHAQQRMAQAQQRKDQEARVRQQLGSQVRGILQGLPDGKLPGTQTQMGPQQQQYIEQFITNPALWQKYLFGSNPGQPDVKGAVVKVGKILFGQQIMQDIAKNTKVETKREIIEGAQNINVPGAGSKSIASTGSGDPFQEFQEAANSLMKFTN